MAAGKQPAFKYFSDCTCGAQKSSATPALEDDVALYLKTATGFSLKSIHFWHDAFYSDCPHGEMDLGDFVALFKRYYKDGEADAWAQHLHRSMDYEQRGRFNFNRFLSMIAIVRKGTFPQHVAWTFDLYDVDHVGLITVGGMTEVLRSIQRISCYLIGGMEAEDLARRFLRRANKHGFEVIDLEQFMAAVNEDDFMIQLALDVV